MFWLCFYMFSRVKTTSCYRALRSEIRRLFDAIRVCLMNRSYADFLRNLLTPNMKKFSMIFDFLGEGGPLVN